MMMMNGWSYPLLYTSNLDLSVRTNALITIKSQFREPQRVTQLREFYIYIYMLLNLYAQTHTVICMQPSFIYMHAEPTEFIDHLCI